MWLPRRETSDERRCVARGQPVVVPSTGSTAPADIAISSDVTCPYCGDVAAFVTGAVIYPHRRDLYARMFYHCLPCQAWVGTHKGTTKPLGRLANAELRRAKIDAHAAFDAKWRRIGWKRGAAYRWLANALGISGRSCHIGMFDVDLCRRVVAVCEQPQAFDAVDPHVGAVSE